MSKNQPDLRSDATFKLLIRSEVGFRVQIMQALGRRGPRTWSIADSQHRDAEQQNKPVIRVKTST
jgi:hypothetical protein